MANDSYRITNAKRCITASPTKDIEDEDIQNKCRVCLMTGEIPIFGEINISADVSEFGGIEVSENDMLPQYICEDCHTLLKSAKYFRSSARKSYQILCKVVGYLSNNTEYDMPVTVKTEVTPVLNKINMFKDLNRDNMEYLDIKTSTSNCGTENITLKKLKFDPVDNRSIYEENSTKGEYLEYGDATSDNTSNTSRESIDLAVHNKPANKSSKDEDMLMIIVSDKEKGDNNSYIKMCQNPEDFENIQVLDTFTKNIQNQVTCEVCQDVVSSKYYEVHMKLHRVKNMEKAQKRAFNKIECKICNKVLSSSYYKFHMKMHGSDTDQATKLRKCNLCDRSFSASYFNDHMKCVHINKNQITSKSSDENKIMQTPICDKKVKEPLYKTHLEKKYVCEKCGMVTNNSSSFKIHCLTHGSELKYKCQFCPYRGLHIGLLRVHVRTHTGEYNYKCTECSSRFLTKSNLNQHMRVHRLPTDFICKACNRGFYTKRSMDKHYKNTHLKLKTHVCETCGKGFGHRDTMLNHQIKAHNRKRLVTKGRLPSYLRPEYNSNREELEEYLSQKHTIKGQRNKVEQLEDNMTS